MATILSQEDIDKKIHCLASAMSKIESNYQELTKKPCIYQLDVKAELVFCLKDIVATPTRDVIMRDFQKQCEYMLGD